MKVYAKIFIASLKIIRAFENYKDVPLFEKFVKLCFKGILLNNCELKASTL